MADDNPVIANIKSRRSIRAYLDEKVPQELIEEILEAGRYAPSALNKQPWEFIVITDKNLIREISAAITGIMKCFFRVLPLAKLLIKDLREEKGLAAMRKTCSSSEDTIFYNAPAVIFIVSRQKGRWTAANCALAGENMALAAHSLGLGSCFIGRALFLPLNKRLCRIIGLARKHKIYFTLALGYAKEFPKTPPARKRDNLICWKK